MSYKVLARKWRPQHFRDMLGQEAVLRALINALDSNRLHHAYLFTGMRGVGKTTIARIFAKCLNCETNGVSASPCGQCSACRDIEAGRFFDLIEVDAASRTKVEETRELLENVPYAPASGRYKVYLIDEVHMFSNHSFNALLKTLEEPPEHVKFLLATTDPQKVPVTVLSRCLQFNLKRMASGALADYLGKILAAESIEFERPALELIARASEGSVRDSLSLVEQAAAFGEGAVREAEVESMLGRASVDRLLGLIESLGQNDLPELFERVEQLAEYAPDFNELMGEILSLLHRIALLQSVPGSVPEDTPGFSRLNQLAASLAGDEVQLFYQIGTHARRDMPFAPDPREAFDMALLRMQAFRPEGGLPASAATRAPAVGVVAKARVQEPSAKPATSKPAAVIPAAAKPAAAKPVAPRTGSANAGVPAATPAASGKPVLIPDQPTTPAPSIASTAGATGTPDTGSAPVTGSAGAGSAGAGSAGTGSAGVGSAGTGSTADASEAPLSHVASEDRASVGPKDWYRIVSELDVSGMPRQLASNCELASVEAERVLLHLESASEHLHSARFIERVESALCSWLGRKVRLDVQLVDAVLDTPARIEERVRADDMAAARQSISQDPLVRQLIDRVDGSVDEASIAPLNER